MNVKYYSTGIYLYLSVARCMLSRTGLFPHREIHTYIHTRKGYILVLLYNIFPSKIRAFGNISVYFFRIKEGRHFFTNRLEEYLYL